ncbi:hypothetical protein ZOSMA_325G00040 [Zostera marina]|uniref:Uncharacterized protein n=1 Tax=Zostera marina TaxID=29655 RepID=A0A0K9P8K2_ZOSMR|nr:hypothetical protein ZOSMA_325G00040 [Zostera marina]
MRVEKSVQLRYGRFFYRFPNGESAADVYDRITGFRETLRADIDIGSFQPPGQQSPTHEPCNSFVRTHVWINSNGTNGPWINSKV